MIQITINSVEQFILSRNVRTREVTVAQNAGATADYPRGLLLKVNTSTNKMEVAESASEAVCALVNSIDKAKLVAGDVKANVAFMIGVAKPFMIDANVPLQITEKFIETVRKNKINIIETQPDKVVEVGSLLISGSFSNTQYTGRAIDKTGLTFKVKYTDGDEKTVSASNITVGNWGDVAGEQTGTFSYTEDGVTISATKEATVVLDTPQSLEVTGDWTNEQIVSTAVDPTGLVFKATYLSGSVDTVTDDVSVSPETWSATAGEQTATFSFTDNETTVTVTKTATVAEAE